MVSLSPGLQTELIGGAGGIGPGGASGRQLHQAFNPAAANSQSSERGWRFSVGGRSHTVDARADLENTRDTIATINLDGEIDQRPWWSLAPNESFQMEIPFMPASWKNSRTDYVANAAVSLVGRHKRRFVLFALLLQAFLLYDPFGFSDLTVSDRVNADYRSGPLQAWSTNRSLPLSSAHQCVAATTVAWNEFSRIMNCPQSAHPDCQPSAEPPPPSPSPSAGCKEQARNKTNSTCHIGQILTSLAATGTDAKGAAAIAQTAAVSWAPTMSALEQCTDANSCSPQDCFAFPSVCTPCLDQCRGALQWFEEVGSAVQAAGVDDCNPISVGKNTNALVAALVSCPSLLQKQKVQHGRVLI